MLTRLVVTLTLAVGSASAAEPIVIAVSERASPPKGVVTVGHVATLSGGDAKSRERIAALDLTEGEAEPVVTKKQIGFRLKLAGFKADEFVLVGADRVAVTVGRKTLAVERVVAVAKAELARRLGTPADELLFDLTQPILVKLPEVADGDEVGLTAEPNSGVAVRLGRNQMNVTVKVNGAQKLSFPVVLTVASVNPLKEPTQAVVQAKATGNTFATEAVMVRARQPVQLVVRTGGMLMTAEGEALQDGKVGQTVRVQNTRSKTVLSGTVVGPGEVEVTLGGTNR
jgi:flagellar basal body P-ring formation protein FlgA